MRDGQGQHGRWDGWRSPPATTARAAGRGGAVLAAALLLGACGGADDVPDATASPSASDGVADLLDPGLPASDLPAPPEVAADRSLPVDVLPPKVGELVRDPLALERLSADWDAALAGLDVRSRAGGYAPGSATTVLVLRTAAAEGGLPSGLADPAALLARTVESGALLRGAAPTDVTGEGPQVGGAETACRQGSAAGRLFSACAVVEADEAVVVVDLTSGLLDSARATTTTFLAALPPLP